MYVLTLEPIDAFVQVKNLIADRILEYVRSTKDLLTAPRQTMFEQGHHAIEIQKYNGGEDCIAYGIPLDAKWEGEAIEEAQQMLREILLDKQRKLGKVKEAKILLLLDSFHYILGSDWRKCLSDSMALSNWSALFLASTEGSQILYSSHAIG